MNKYYLKILVLMLGIILGLSTLATPKPNNDSLGEFNVTIASRHIEEISRKPHNVYNQSNLEEVRDYISDQMETYIGEENITEYHYQHTGLGYDVKNYLGRIQGKNDGAILLVAHYDSGIHYTVEDDLKYSYGAADDGYGVAVLLEMLRLFSEEELENTIYVLFTDAEETGLHGAKYAIKEDFIDDVRFVINVEARGLEGPVYMFETGKSTKNTIEFFEHANYPMGYSVASSIYNILPNNTDFTTFKDEGFNGFNFSVLKGGYYYHTAYDNYENISEKSLQHYGEQITNLVSEYISDSKYSEIGFFDDDQEMIYFTFLPNYLISYSKITSMVMSTLIMIVSLFLIVVNPTDKMDKLKGSLKSIGYFFITILVTSLFMYYFSRFISGLFDIEFKMVDLRIESPGFITLLTFITAVLVLYMTYNRIIKTSQNTMFLSTSVIILSIVSLIITIVLPGASFIFLVPAFVSTLSLVILKYSNNKYVKNIFISFAVIVCLTTVVPLVYGLYLGISFGGLFALHIISTFYVTIVSANIRALA